MKAATASEKIESFSLNPGRLIARKYEVVSLLGAGWEGEVYKVRERNTGVERAAKLFFPQRNLRNKTSNRYAQKLHKLFQCPIVIQYHAEETILFRKSPVTVLISEFVDGQLLTHFLKSQPGNRLTPFQAVHLLHSLCLGLESIHGQGEYHGDLHAENVIVARYGLSFDLKLLDLFHWKAPKKENIQDDICSAIQIFHQTLGGKNVRETTTRGKADLSGIKKRAYSQKIPANLSAANTPGNNAMGVALDDKNDRWRLWSEVVRMEPESISLSKGHAVVFTSRSPGGERINEDALLCHQEGVIAVADGVGGARIGNEAAQLAVLALASELDKRKESLRSCILNGFEKANREVLGLGVGAATTLTVMEVCAETIRSYHVGDSFVLLVGRGGKLKYQTIDHTPSGYGVEAGLLEEHEAMNHAERHVVTNVVGSEDMRIEIGPTITMSPKDTVVVGTDGLSDNLSIDEIANLVRKGELESCAKRLASACEERMSAPEGTVPSKADDLTYALYRIF